MYKYTYVHNEKNIKFKRPLVPVNKIACSDDDKRGE